MTTRSVEQREGFSLVESLVTVFLGGIVLTAAYTVVVGQERVFAVQEKVVGTQQDVRAAAMFMTREIRMAGYDPYQSCLPEEASDGNTDPDRFVTATVDTVTLNICANPATPAYRTITYTRNAVDRTLVRSETVSGGALLTLGTSGEPLALAENVGSLTFRYYDASGADVTASATTQAARDTIRTVGVSVAGTVGGNTMQLNSDVSIRNVQD